VSGAPSAFVVDNVLIMVDGDLHNVMQNPWPAASDRSKGADLLIYNS
jgi:hypothetical protein